MQKQTANLLLIFAIGYFGFNLWQQGTSRIKGNDFAHYYVSSKIWLQDDNNVYQQEFKTHYQALGIQPKANETLVDRATNPPGLIALFASVAFLPPPAAYLAWNSIQVLSLLAAILLVWSLVKSRVDKDDFKLIISMFLLSQIVTRHFYYSQVQLLLLVIVLAAFRFSIRGNHRLSCSLICIATLVKIFPAFLLPWFIWQAKGWRARTSAFAWSINTLALGICFTGIPMWQAFLGNATAEISTWSNANTSLTISSLLAKIGKFGFNSESLIFSYESGVVISALFAIAIYGFVFTNGKNKNLQFSLLTIAMLICGPTCWLHYLVFALLPACVLVEDSHNKISPTKLTCMLLLFLCVNHFFMTETNNIVILFGFKYAPLAAMIIILGMLIRKNLSAGRSPAPTQPSAEPALQLNTA